MADQQRDPVGDAVVAAAVRARNRLDLWSTLLALDEAPARTVAEIGVYRGKFAAHVLDSCPGIERYYLVDPWRHLDDWAKPANRADDEFARIHTAAMTATAPHAARRVVLRGRTTEVVDQIPEGSLDVAYVDGDHTLRGIVVDLVALWSRVRPGGWVGGDDFSRSIWQHGTGFEPTLVFPVAVHVAEAHGARIFALPYRQFLIEKPGERTPPGFELVDLSRGQGYPGTGLLAQVRPRERRRSRRRRPWANLR